MTTKIKKYSQRLFFLFLPIIILFLWEEINTKMKNIVLLLPEMAQMPKNYSLFLKNNQGTVVAIFLTKPDAKVLDRAKNHDIPSVVFNKTQLNEGFVLEQLHQFQPDLIVLAGFLLKFPESILKNIQK